MTLALIFFGFVIGAIVAALPLCDVIAHQAERNRDMEAQNASLLEAVARRDADLLESRQATADEAMRANKLTAEVRRLSKR